MEEEGPPLWVARDCWQRDIRLHEDTWYNHILTDHRSLHGHEAAVATVLVNPFRVMHDSFHENRECYYRQRAHPRFADLLLKVCVEFETDYDGLVITAYLTPKIDADEVQKWP